MSAWPEIKAENIGVEDYRDRRGDAIALEITFDFLCPNCGERHKGREISDRYFPFVGYFRAEM